VAYSQVAAFLRGLQQGRDKLPLDLNTVPPEDLRNRRSQLSQLYNTLKERLAAARGLLPAQEIRELESRIQANVDNEYSRWDTILLDHLSHLEGDGAQAAATAAPPDNPRPPGGRFRDLWDSVQAAFETARQEVMDYLSSLDQGLHKEPVDPLQRHLDVIQERQNLLREKYALLRRRIATVWDTMSEQEAAQMEEQVEREIDPRETEWMDRFDQWLTEEQPETGHSQRNSREDGSDDIITPPITAEVETMLAGTFRPENIHDPPEGLGQNTQVPFLPRTFSSSRAALVNGEENTSKPVKPKDDQVISEPRKPVRDPETVSARDPREEIPEEGHITETPRTSRQPKFAMPEAWKSGATRDPPPDPGENGVQRPRRRSPEERRCRNEQWQLYLRREHDYATQNQSGTTPTEEGGEGEGQPQGSEVGKEVEFEKVLSSEEVVGESTPSVIEVNSSPQSEESSFHGFPSRGEEPPGRPNLESDLLQAEPDNAVQEGSNPEPCLTDSEEAVERLVLAELAKQSLPPPDAGQEEVNGWADWLQILPPRTEEK